MVLPTNPGRSLDFLRPRQFHRLSLRSDEDLEVYLELEVYLNLMINQVLLNARANDITGPKRLIKITDRFTCTSANVIYLQSMYFMQKDIHW